MLNFERNLLRPPSGHRFAFLKEDSRDLRSSAMLHSVDRQLVTDVSTQPVGPIFKGQALNLGPTGCLEMSVSNYVSTLRNITEEHKCHLHRGGSFKLGR